MREEHTDRPAAAEPGQGHGGQWPAPAPAAERKAEEKAEAIREKENLMGAGPEPGEPQSTGPGPRTSTSSVERDSVPNTTQETAREPAPEQASTSRPGPGGDPSQGLFEASHTEEFRRRWDSIKASFVDDPREAVRRADELTDELMRELTKAMESRRRDLSEQWKHSESPDDKAETERLRVALHNYRSMLDPILRV